MKRRCKKCGEKEEFYKVQTAWCKKCSRAAALERKKKLKEIEEPFLDKRRAKPEQSRYMLVEEWREFRKEVRGERWLLLWDFVLYFGLRISEALLLRKKDFNKQKRTLTIYVLKHKKGKDAPVLSELPSELFERFSAITEDTFFPFTYRQAWKEFKETAKRAGLNARYSPHALRHLSGTKAYETFKDLIAVKHHLRHTSTSTTERYIHVAVKGRKEIADKIWKGMQE